VFEAKNLVVINKDKTCQSKFLGDLGTHVANTLKKQPMYGSLF